MPPEPIARRESVREMAKVCADYFGGLIKGLGGGYLLSPAGGMGRKSLLTRGSAGGVYFLDGIEASAFSLPSWEPVRPS